MYTKQKQSLRFKHSDRIFSITLRLNNFSTIVLSLTECRSSHFKMQSCNYAVYCHFVAFFLTDGSKNKTCSLYHTIQCMLAGESSLVLLVMDEAKVQQKI